ncbi:MAG: isopeptide-forming domain-containing fimbrial protein [Anaerovoracaceae bacterium]
MMKIKQGKRGGLLLLIVLIMTIIPSYSFGAVSLENTAPVQVGSGGTSTTGAEGFKGHKGVYTSWEEDSTSFIMPAGYSNKTTSPPTMTSSTFGKTCDPVKARDIYCDEHKNTNVAVDNYDTTDYYCFNITENTKGNCGIWVKGADYFSNTTGEIVKLDVKITIMDWEDATGKKTNNSHHIMIEKDPRANVINLGMNSSRIRFDYYQSGTDNKYTLKSNLTFSDVDSNQYIAFSTNKAGNNGIVQQFVSTDSRLNFGYNDGDNIYYASYKENILDVEPSSAFGLAFATDGLEFTFGSRQDGAWAFFGYTGYSMFRTEPNKPVKSVEDGDEKNKSEENNTANTLYNTDEEFTYTISDVVPSGVSPEFYFKSMVMEDTLKDILIIKSATTNTDDFDVKVKGQKVTATAKKSSLERDSFYGKKYDLIIKAKLNIKGDLTPYLNNSKNMITVNNKGEVTIVDDAKTYSEPTPQVSTKVGIPDLQIDKKTDKYEYQVGDKIQYQIDVSHTDKSKGNAANVVVEDISLPEGMVIDEDTLKASGIKAKYYISKIKGGWQLTTGDLPKGDIGKISFTAVANKTLNGKEIPNKATVKCDLDEQKSDEAKVYINSPKMDIIKITDKKEYKAGERIPYELQVSQENSGCFMRDIAVSDTIETEGAKLMPGSIQILDKNGKVITQNCEVKVKGNSFTIDPKLHMGDKTEKVPAKGAAYDRLALTSKLQVNYDVAVDKGGIESGQIKNTAVTPATKNTNGDLIKDDKNIPSGGDKAENSVGVKGPELKIIKTSDKPAYKVKDTGKYKLVVMEIREDYTVKNIVIRDEFQKDGMIIDRKSLKVKDGDSDITAKCKIQFENDYSFVINTDKDLPWGKQIIVTYDVTFESDELNEEEVENIAFAKGDKVEERKDEHKVTITEEPETVVASTEPKETIETTDPPEATVAQVKEEEPPQPSEKPTQSVSEIEETDPSQDGAVQTGDDSQLWIVVVLAIIGGGIMLATRKKKSKKINK